MVLYKRKPVKFEPSPDIDDSTDVWSILETGEVFVDYEKFLNRRDFYEQKKFMCESTGHTGYTFFEAKESEAEPSKEINSILSDDLRARVLDYVQFQSTSRMDDLVNDVFDHFKEQYMVRDYVSIDNDTVRRYGQITAMTTSAHMTNGFAAQLMDDPPRPTSYEITLDDSGEKIMRYKLADLQRNRKFYSKLLLKVFLRDAVRRELWVGAPWMVLEHLAKRYKISTKMPDLKTREALLAQKRAAQRALTSAASPPVQQSFPHQTANGHPPHVNGHGSQPQPQAPGQGQATFVNFSANGPQQYQQQQQQNQQNHQSQSNHPNILRTNAPPHLQGGPPPPHLALMSQHPPPHLMYSRGPPIFPPSMFSTNAPPHLQYAAQQHHMAMHQPFQTSFVHNPAPPPANFPQPQQPPQLARPFEPVKYPMEDLEIRQPKTNPVRPSLKFFSDDVPVGVEAPDEDKKTGILMKSVGPLLFTWETLNVHDTIYMLDSFTFDDFVSAMRFADENEECELLVEVHCSILKQIVSPSGKILTPLPKMAETEDSEDEEESSESTPTPEPEPPKRTTRSSLRKSGAQEIVRQRTPTPEPPKELHKAEQFCSEFNWIEQCKIRNFREGGWQAIMVALLYRLSFDPIQKDACDEVLAQLVPPDEEPTIEAIANHYVQMDVNLRVSALERILRMTVATEAFRDQLLAAAQDMTKLRKEKIDFQRKRKELADELFKLDLERKIHLPANTPASPVDTKEEDIDISMTSAMSDTKDIADADGDDAEEPSAAKARLRHSNKNKRKTAAEEARKEKAKKTKLEAEKTKKQKDWEKLLDSIEKKKEELRECEANINELDDDLRETMVHRSKTLGKDRFLNKYFWFEHNGMPFGGVPNSSTADHGYANGRIWVQGPDEYELRAVMEEPAVSQDRQRFGFDIPQRKQKEEGDTHLSTSTEWAYYDDPEDIDNLLGWFDERGIREKALRKELLVFRDRIAEYMDKLKKHLSHTEMDEDEDEDEDITTRASTRKKTNVDRDSSKGRSLLWTNSIMREEYGYNHSEEYEPPKKGKAKPVKAIKGKGKR